MIVLVNVVEITLDWVEVVVLVTVVAGSEMVEVSISVVVANSVVTDVDVAVVGVLSWDATTIEAPTTKQATTMAITSFPYAGRIASPKGRRP